MCYPLCLFDDAKIRRFFYPAMTFTQLFAYTPFLLTYIKETCQTGIIPILSLRVALRIYRNKRGLRPLPY